MREEDRISEEDIQDSVKNLFQAIQIASGLVRLNESSSGPHLHLASGFCEQIPFSLSICKTRIITLSASHGCCRAKFITVSSVESLGERNSRNTESMDY